MFPVKNLLQQLEPTFRATFDPGTKFSFTILQDLAEALPRDVVTTLNQVTRASINIATREFYEAAEFVQNLVAKYSNQCHRLTGHGIQ
ncbi:hypothetical protein PENSUB_11529 [Penicillium subrubescens]|uniref:Uncharacterized protein n=1 Tax=Penicillium subrubescens TaxID=1316194 RepID=A0A1Q5T380_9EURO|nr:hypothetical protein PENSUB_11529 [Penicillium subrubescens]